MNEPMTALPEGLLRQLQKEKFVLLTTVDQDSGGPANNAISWVYAANPSTIRFAVDARSRIVGNLTKSPLASVTFFADGTVYTAYGKAKVVAEALDNVPFKLACFDIAIESIRDTMFYGSRITQEPEYEKKYDKRAAEKLDNQVFEAMRKA
jgi:hypothetical protein